MALVPYSARVSTIRSPGPTGKARTAAFHAVVLDSTSAMSSGRGADELGRSPRRCGPARGRRLGRLVAPDLGLELEVADDGVEDGLGEERGAGVVEVQHPLAAGREGPGLVHVEGRHRRSVPI